MEFASLSMEFHEIFQQTRTELEDGTLNWVHLVFIALSGVLNRKNQGKESIESSAFL